jgi:hypothetical protein
MQVFHTHKLQDNSNDKHGCVKELLTLVGDDISGVIATSSSLSSISSCTPVLLSPYLMQCKYHLSMQCSQYYSSR